VTYISKGTISNRKNYNKSLQENNALAYAAFLHNPIQTIVVDSKGKIIAFNKREKISGNRLPRLGEVMYKEYAVNHEIDMHIELNKCIKSGRRSGLFELKYSDRIFTVNISPFDGGAIITFLNITGQKKAERSLQESEEKYRNLVDTINIGVYRNKGATLGQFIYANQALARIHGYDSVEEFLKVRASDLYQFPKECKQLVEELNQLGLVKEKELCLRKKDGSIIFVLCTAKVCYDKNGNIKWTDGIIEDITEQKQAEKRLKQSFEKLRRTLGSTVQAMALAVESRDPYTAGHQRRVADLARSIAAEMKLSNDKIDGLRLAGLIHDIGKISIPAEILSKPTRLSNAEFELIKNHSKIGYDILKSIDFPWPVAQIVYQHHERINSTGYPLGLSGNDILIEARILAVSDVVEAMATHRPYRATLGMKEALKEIKKNRGILYEPKVVDACFTLFNKKGYLLKE